jgi:hypothetical protein
MDGTILVVGARSIEQSYGGTIVADVRLVHGWRSRLLSWLCHTVDLTSIGNDMRRGRVVDQVHHLAFLDRDRVLLEVGRLHVHRRQITRVHVFYATCCK